MKKALLTLIILFLSHTIVLSQNGNKDATFKLGLNVGPNYTSLRGGDFADGYTPQLGFFGGLNFEYQINSKLSIITGIHYDAKNLKADFIDTFIIEPIGGPNETFETIIDNELKFKYINIPIAARYYFSSANRYFLDVGFFYNHLLKAQYIKSERQDSDLAVLGTNDDNLTDFIKNGELGISLGIGKNWTINQKNQLNVVLRNDFGFQDIQENSFFGVTSIKTNTLRLILNWNFEL
jgi:hypothetical protein